MWAHPAAVLTSDRPWRPRPATQTTRLSSRPPDDRDATSGLLEAPQRPAGFESRRAPRLVGMPPLILDAARKKYSPGDLPDPLRPRARRGTRSTPSTRTRAGPRRGVRTPGRHRPRPRQERPGARPLATHKTPLPRPPAEQVPDGSPAAVRLARRAARLTRRRRSPRHGPRGMWHISSGPPHSLIVTTQVGSPPGYGWP
jgi:hypothetical protein